LPVPYPRTGQGGEPRLTLPDAITGNEDPNLPAQFPGRYPYRPESVQPAPPPGGPPPGPPAGGSRGGDGAVSFMGPPASPLTGGPRPADQAEPVESDCSGWRASRDSHH